MCSAKIVSVSLDFSFGKNRQAIKKVRIHSKPDFNFTWDANYVYLNKLIGFNDSAFVIVIVHLSATQLLLCNFTSVQPNMRFKIKFSVIFNESRSELSSWNCHRKILWPLTDSTWMNTFDLCLVILNILIMST